MKIELPLLILFFLFFQITDAQDQLISIPQKSPLEKIQTQVGIIDIELEYSRPSMRDRKIFGGLVPFDKIWRTGANINTRITFSGSVKIGDQTIESGAYSIFTKPGLDDWEIYFHTEYNKYGEPDDMLTENIIAKITIPSEPLEREIETFSIQFENLTDDSVILALSWEKTYVGIPIKIGTVDIMNVRLEETKKQTADAYAYAAWNYFSIEKDSESALKAIDFSISLIEKDTTYEQWLLTLDPKDWSLPWHYQIKSEMHADLGQFDEAINAAKRSLKIAVKLEDAVHSINKNKENIAKWSK